MLGEVEMGEIGLGLGELLLVRGDQEIGRESGGSGLFVKVRCEGDCWL